MSTEIQCPGNVPGSMKEPPMPSAKHQHDAIEQSGQCSLCATLLAACLLSAMLSCGCAALTNPTMNGIPVRRLPPELLARPREQLRTIPLTALRQDPPQIYRLAPHDVLGVYI